MNESGGVILLYHRVTTLDTDPQLLAVAPANFASQMEILREFARPMALADMVASARRGDDLRNAVAITFDDGYADNLLQAKPILESKSIPATVFVASAGIDSDCEFFWDELDRIFLQPNRLPHRLSVEIGNSPYETELGDVAEYSHGQWVKSRNWNVTNSQSPTARQRIYLELCALIHQADTKQRRAALMQIRRWSGLPNQVRPTHRMMNRAQLREIVEGNLIDIGGHTISHPLLSAESCEVQQQEIAGGKSALEAVLGRELKAFSYPFGTRRDYTPKAISAATSAGFELACSNFQGRVNRETDACQLPRIIVRDWSAAEFRDRLSSYFLPIAA